MAADGVGQHNRQSPARPRKRVQKAAADTARALPRGDDGAIKLAPADRGAEETLGEFVHRRLRHAIMTGRIAPGKALTIRGLAAALGVSAMPVREAMRRLIAEHALDSLDNRRVRVAPMTERRFSTLIETRVMLECEAARRALPHVTPQALADLRALDAVDDAAVADGDLGRAIEANFAFHRHLYMLAPDDALTPLIESIWLQIGPFMRAAIEHLAQYYQHDRHAEALAAIARGDAPALARAIEADIRDGIGHIAASAAALGGQA